MDSTLKLIAITIAILVAANSLLASIASIDWKKFKKLSRKQKWHHISPKLTALAPTLLGSIALASILMMM